MYGLPVFDHVWVFLPPDCFVAKVGGGGIRSACLRLGFAGAISFWQALTARQFPPLNDGQSLSSSPSSPIPALCNLANWTNDISGEEEKEVEENREEEEEDGRVKPLLPHVQ